MLSPLAICFLFVTISLLILKPSLLFIYMIGLIRFNCSQKHDYLIYNFSLYNHCWESNQHQNTFGVWELMTIQLAREVENLLGTFSVSDQLLAQYSFNLDWTNIQSQHPYWLILFIFYWLVSLYFISMALFKPILFYCLTSITHYSNFSHYYFEI